MQKEPPQHVAASPKEEKNMLVWESVLTGPMDTPHEGGKFTLSLVFPKEYPFKPPHIKFVTPMFHPNIARVCDDFVILICVGRSDLFGYSWFRLVRCD
jgi:ubiquitin-conjugating enzyme E2 A